MIVFSPTNHLTSTQEQLIHGSLLGDGAMRCKQNALLEINHCFAQREYVDWKYEILSDLVLTPPLTPLATAVWFMDDGHKSYKAVYFNTQQFEPRDQILLVQLLGKFGIHARMNMDKSYQRIRVATSSVSELRSLISSHLLPQFNYKLPP